MMDKVDFRFSDTDFSTYLILKGYSPTYIEITNDKKLNKLKAFTHFEGYKEDFIYLQNEYEIGNLLVNPKDFSKTRKKLNELIKSKLNEYRKNTYQ
jgi:hypothetical protein